MSKKNHSFSIEDLQQVLENQDFDCNLQQKDDSSLKSLFVYLGIDHKERPKVLEIILNIQDFGQELSDTPGKPQKFAKTIFLIPLPYKVKDSAIPQTISLVHMLNRYLELPGFQVIEEEGKIYYRYVLLTDIGTISSTLLLSLIGMMMATLNLFSPTIELVSSGEMTQNALLEQIFNLNK